MLPQSFLDAVEQHTRALRWADNINVVQESEDELAFAQSSPHGLQRRMLPEGIQGRHERVTLFAALRLMQQVGGPAASYHTYVDGLP